MIVGCSAVAPNHQLSLLYAATAFGFAMSIALMAVAHISGGHVNPAVTVAALVLGKLSPISAVLYVLSQCIGGLIGMQAVLFMQPDSLSGEFCVTQLAPGVDPLKGVAVEAIFTSILALLACSSFDHRNSNKLDSSPIRFGIAIIALTIAGRKLTGCSMNPARSLAPALLFGNFNNLWVYWAGPMGGGLLMSLFYRLVLYENTPPEFHEDSLEHEPLTNMKSIFLQTRRDSHDIYAKTGE
ncbi:aquaporin AQPcic isoform X2 [Nilaparvata lugens]|nr:aquaporin AQPcic isoform X2 [Nilaparvata lugens]